MESSAHLVASDVSRPSSLLTGGAADAALEALLAERWAEARRAWPGLQVRPGDFWRYLAARLPPDGDRVAQLGALRTSELYLTCACERGDRRAHALLEAAYFRRVVSALRRIDLGSVGLDEMTQLLRARLLVSDGARPAKIGAYAGRGDLGSWLCVTAVRLAQRRLRREKREVPADEQRLAELALPDAERGYLQGLYRSQVREAVAVALGALAAREKSLLEHYYFDGLTIEELGARYGAHRITVSRWLDAIRQRLLDGTRRALASRLRASQRDCDSIIKLVHSQLDLTLQRLLAAP